MEKLRAKYGWPTGGMPGMPPVKQPGIKPLQPVPLVDLKFSDSTNWPEDSRPEVKAVYQFAKVAKLYNFDPAVMAYKDSLRYQKTVVTTTHEADIDIRNQRITDIYSYYGRSHSMTEYSGVTDDWAKGTGTWNEQQMAAETFRILRELGYTETLAAVRQGSERFTPQPWRVNLPEGGQKIIYPFAVVKLYDANGQTRVTAEYRMGPDGPVGLVDWFSLY
jgi:hypothetical protein